MPSIGRNPFIEKLLIAAILGEIIAPLSVILLRPGFDKANSLGLDFDFVVWMGWFFGVLWAVGCGFSWAHRKARKRYLIIHLILSPLFLALLWGCYSHYLKA
jgi:hypothetical protein